MDNVLFLMRRFIIRNDQSIFSIFQQYLVNVYLFVLVYITLAIDMAVIYSPLVSLLGAWRNNKIKSNRNEIYTDLCIGVSLVHRQLILKNPP